MEKLVDYIEFKLDAPKAREEELTMLLFDNGAQGVEVDDPGAILQHLEQGDWDASVFDKQNIVAGQVHLRSLMPLDETGRRAAEAVRAATNAMDDVDCEINVVEPVDWQEKWKEGFKARPVGDKLWLKPYWDDTPAPEGRVTLKVNPGMAFGTGDHPTTSMMLEMIEEYIEPGQTVVDLGCGSGILAIAALLLGAGSALGCDIDPAVPAIAAENAALNGVEGRFRALCGDAAADEDLRRVIGGAKYDLVFMNIVTDVILRLLPDVPRWLKPGGTLLLSGVIDGREGEIEEALAAGGWRYARRRLEDWHSFVCTGGERT